MLEHKTRKVNSGTDFGIHQVEIHLNSIAYHRGKYGIKLHHYSTVNIAAFLSIILPTVARM